MKLKNLPSCLEIIEGETAEIVEDASFCQIYNEKNEQEEQPIVDLDKKTKCSNISLDSDLSDTGKCDILRVIEIKLER